MPKLSKQSAEEMRQGPGTYWAGQLGGYTTNLVINAQDADLTPLLQGLPDDKCPSPHWGYVFKGTMWWRYADGHEEVIREGEAFYAPPGHTAGASGGSEFLVFSPSEIMGPVEAHMAKRAQELQSQHS